MGKCGKMGFKKEEIHLQHGVVKVNTFPPPETTFRLLLFLLSLWPDFTFSLIWGERILVMRGIFTET